MALPFVVTVTQDVTLNLLDETGLYAPVTAQPPGSVTAPYVLATAAGGNGDLLDQSGSIVPVQMQALPLGDVTAPYVLTSTIERNYQVIDEYGNPIVVVAQPPA